MTKLIDSLLLLSAVVCLIIIMFIPEWIEHIHYLLIAVLGYTVGDLYGKVRYG